MKPEVLFSAEALAARVAELGAAITARHRGHPLVIVGVLKGAFVFLADLVRAIDLPLRVDFLAVSSYGAGTETSGEVRIVSDLSRPIAGEHVIVVEDIVDTGLTMRYLLELLQSRHPASLEVCALLCKPDRARVKVTVDHIGFTIPDLFVVGYGLDHGEEMRNLPYLGVVPDEH